MNGQDILEDANDDGHEGSSKTSLKIPMMKINQEPYQFSVSLLAL